MTGLTWHARPTDPGHASVGPYAGLIDAVGYIVDFELNNR